MKVIRQVGCPKKKVRNDNLLFQILLLGCLVELFRVHRRLRKRCLHRFPGRLATGAANTLGRKVRRQSYGRKVKKVQHHHSKTVPPYRQHFFSRLNPTRNLENLHSKPLRSRLLKSMGFPKKSRSHEARFLASPSEVTTLWIAGAFFERSSFHRGGPQSNRLTYGLVFHHGPMAEDMWKKQSTVREPAQQEASFLVSLLKLVEPKEASWWNLFVSCSSRWFA